MAKSLLICFFFLVLFHACAARRNQQEESECQLQRLNALQPNRKIQSEGGVTEHWDENNQQFECAGVAAIRHTIQPRGLLLPQFSNSPKLTYIVQGRGLQGAVIPGCPETYQSSQQQARHGRGGQSESESESASQSQSQQGYEQDRHQKIKDLREGDIVATPAGVAHWFYNDAQRPLVMVTIYDTSNNDNQLDQRRRDFYLAGNPQQEGRQQGQHGGSQQEQESESESNSNNIFQALGDQYLAEALNVRRETVRKLKSQNDRRGNIVRVENGLQFVSPPRTEQREQERQQQGQQGRKEQQEGTGTNGIEETFCTMRYRENIGEPIRADIYNPQAGRIRSINSGTLPILRNLQLSAERAVLYSNAQIAPHWNLNAHSVIYVTKGSAQVQIVGNYQRPVFNGQVREGQILIVPQNFVVVTQAGSNGFEYVAFKTNDNAMTSPVAGKTSVLAAMPVDVLINAYRGLSREEAMNLKNNRRHETMVLEPSRSQGGRAFA